VGDPACIQVLNRHTFEQVAVWHGHCEPVAFADRLASSGTTTTRHGQLRDRGWWALVHQHPHVKMFYPNVWRYRQADRLPGSMTNSFGWSMNWQRKQMAIAFVIDLLGQKMLTIHDEVTYDQMANYVSLRYGELGPASEKGKDDAVTSLAIAVGPSASSSRVPVTPMRCSSPTSSSSPATCSSRLPLWRRGSTTTSGEFHGGTRWMTVGTDALL